MRIVLPSLLLMVVLGFTQCNPFEARGPIPSYVAVDTLRFVTVNSNATGFQGSNSHNFTDVWVFINGRALGMYQLPAIIPILSETGQFRLGLAAGIRVNGMFNRREAYPFTQIWEKNIFVEPGTLVSIHDILDGDMPTIEYGEQVRFFIRDFEDPNSRLEKITPSDTSMNIVPNTWGLPYLQTGVAEVYLTPDKPRALLKTPNETRLPAGGRIFLEIDYNTTIEFTVNILTSFLSGPPNRRFVMGALPSARDGVRRWNKIYVDLSDPIGQVGAGIRHEIYIEAENTTGEDQVLYFDNIKIVHF